MENEKEKMTQANPQKPEQKIQPGTPQSNQASTSTSTAASPEPIQTSNQQGTSKMGVAPGLNEEEPYPEQIREAQGDLADRAEIEIEQEIQEKILEARRKLQQSNPRV